MNSSCYNLTEDWGWFVDVESLKYTSSDFIKYPIKKYNLHNKNLPVIKERDEYEITSVNKQYNYLMFSLSYINIFIYKTFSTIYGMMKIC